MIAVTGGNGSRPSGVQHFVRTSIRFVTITLGVLAVSFIPAGDAQACSCAGPFPPGRAFAASSAVFHGRVVRVPPVKPENFATGSRIVFQVTKSWKGVEASTTEIRNSFACSFSDFTVGKEYLVYADGPSRVVSMCGRTRAADRVVLEMALLDALARGEKEETFMLRLPDLLLRDPRPSVRTEAAWMLGRDASKEIALGATPALIGALGDPSADVRLAVIATFDSGPWIHVDQNTRSIGHALLPTLRDVHPSVRRESARILVKFWFLPETEPALRAALKAEQTRTKPDAAVIAGISSTLATIGGRQSKQAVVPLLVQELRHADAARRREAAQKLGKIGADGAAAVLPLIGRLADPDEYVRYYAAEALGAIGSGEAVPALRKAFFDTKKDVRAQAVHAIHLIGDDRVVQREGIPVLVASLGDELARYHSIRILGEIGPAAYPAVPALGQWLAKVRSHEVGHIASALEKIGPRAKSAVPALIASLPGADDSRWMIVRALQKIDVRSPEVVRALEHALDDKDDQVRAAAASALVQWNNPRGTKFVRVRIVPALIADLTSKDLEKRRQAANLLSRWGPFAASAVPALVIALSDPDEWMPRYAATALGAIASHAATAVPGLTGMLSHRESRDAAAAALGQIGVAAKPAVPHLIRVLDDDRPSVRATAAEALREIGSPEARRAFDAFAAREVPLLRTWLEDRDRKDRGEAARCLIHLAPHSLAALPALIDALGDPDWLTRTTSAEALGALGSLAEAAVPALSRTLNDRNAYPREAAAAALEKIGSPAALRALADLRRIPS